MAADKYLVDGFYQFSGLVSGIFGDACDFAIQSDSGDIISTNPDLEMILSSSNNLESDFNVVNITSTNLNNRRVYSASIENVLGNRLVLSVSVVEDRLSSFQAYNSEQFSSFVLSLVALFNDNYCMSKELDSMAKELSDRYEELNLVYESETIVKNKSHILLSMQEIMEGCVSHVDVDAAIIFIPGKKIHIKHIQPGPINKVTDNYAHLVETTYSIVRQTSDVLIVNNSNESMSYMNGVPAKIMATPISSTDKDIDGVLVVIRNDAAEDFSNSDRNIIAAMSKKISQVIHQNYDYLTGMLNRSSFESRLADVIKHDCFMNTEHILMNIDLDNFQLINDEYGHDVGDDLIRAVSESIKLHVRDTDVISRLFGDEFGVLLCRCPRDTGLRIATKINKSIRNIKLDVDGGLIEISATIGMVVVNDQTARLENAITDAEVAKVAAKEQGKNRVMLFDKGDSELELRKTKMKWVGRLRDALRNDKFVLFAQPIISLTDHDNEDHVEILLRLQGDDGGFCSPLEFIPAAESYHLMPDIDRWVVKNAFELISKYESEITGHRLMLSINLSGQSFCSHKFTDYIIQQLESSTISPDRVCFEVTESSAIANLGEAIKFI
ncbi:MAG: diguanylate cyclase, partial [Gammaproteobacteria bacterium]|nr:diguanylate cyclase [Gammaproteobacteria bacterium]